MTTRHSTVLSCRARCIREGEIDHRLPLLTREKIWRVCKSWKWSVRPPDRHRDFDESSIRTTSSDTVKLKRKLHEEPRYFTIFNDSDLSSNMVSFDDDESREFE